jgi:site-specific recombinase XerD
MSVRFVLDNPVSKKETFIFILISCWDGRLKYSTREKVLPTFWDPLTQRPVVPKNDQTAKAKYLKICRIYDSLERLISNHSITGDPVTKEMAVEQIQAVLQHKPINRKIKFSEAAEKIIQEMKSGEIVVPKSGKRYSPGTIKNYGMSLRVLMDFSAAKKISIEFNSVTIHTYQKFIEYCHLQNWSLNYTGQHLKNWRCIIAKAYKKGLHKNRIWDFEDFKTLQEETFDIFLSEEELKQIINLDLSKKTKEITAARDWFIIGCYTGLRVSDLTRLDDSKVDKGYLLLANEKTDETVMIPIHPEIRKILKKQKGFPMYLADQTINEKIKIVAKDAKIKGKVLYTVTEGGKRKDYYLEKWQMVSLHTARRSFITNARKNGIPDSIVMKLTGIRKPATLQRYDKLSAQDAAVIASQHKFFK